MKQKLILWVEEYLFYPNFFQKLISYLFLPLTFIYITVVLAKRIFAKPKEFNIPIISVGNIVVGGSGKTPFIIKLANKYSKSCVILRGYGRESKGLFVVKNNSKILEDIKTSGDEANLIAKSTKDCIVIVSEDRVEAINKAKELGAKIVFLDDAFSKINIRKYEILLEMKKEPTNNFCLPSGCYREPKIMYNIAHMILKEGRDFNRVVTYSYQNTKVDKLPKNTLLLTAISKPKRLLEFLPQDIKMIAFEDHHNFTKEELESILEQNKDSKFITTQKDFVKLKDLGFEDVYLMELDLDIDSIDFSSMNAYIDRFK